MISDGLSPSPNLNCRSYGYEANDHWEKLPEGWTWKEATAVAVDSHDRVFVFNRSDHPVIVFDRDGSFQFAWGEGLFASAHGITIGPDDSVYCTDHYDHTVRKFTPEGKLLLTLGTSGKPSDTGATSIDYRGIHHPGPPFNFPTNVALSATGDLYISDGYGNARIHQFAPDGRLIRSWGEPGSGPGQFFVPHGIAIDSQGKVYVADRENSRIQIFSPEGEYLTEWREIARPCQVFIGRDDTVYVTELGYYAGMWPGTSAPAADSPGGRVTIFSLEGKVLARWGGGINPCAAGDFFAPHDIGVDSQGDIYVAEVTASAGGDRGVVPPDCHSFQKFTRTKQ